MHKLLVMFEKRRKTKLANFIETTLLFAVLTGLIFYMLIEITDKVIS